MSGAWLFWIIVDDCWSMLSQLTTCTSRVYPVLSWYVLAKASQNAFVWSLEYSAATILIVLTSWPLPPLAPAVVPAPVPPPHAPRARPAMARPATTTDFFVDVMSLLGSVPGVLGACSHAHPATVTPNLERRLDLRKSNDDRNFDDPITITQTWCARHTSWTWTPAARSASTSS